MDTSSAMYLGQNLGTEMSEQEAELYCRLYSLAAEDFTTLPDVLRYIQGNTECLLAIQKLLKTLMSILSKHTHTVPEHSHPIEPHTHPDPVSGITGPNVNALVTFPVPLLTNLPVESSQIMWSDVPTSKYINTTGALPNLEGNMIIIGPTLKGPIRMVKRRTKVPLILANPSVPPLVKEMVMPL